MNNDQTSAAPCGLYGFPPRELADTPRGAVQLSPLSPGATAFEAVGDGQFDSLTMLAPPGAVERRWAIAQVLRTVRVGGELTVMAPKDKGGSRLKKELEAFGCDIEEEARRHHRIAYFRRPEEPTGVVEAIAEGAPRLVADLGLWSQPGMFSWDRIDPGSRLLAENLPPMAGQGADFGCGVGYLAHGVLASPKVTALHLIDIDSRAVECARRNAADPRVTFTWGDARSAGLSGLDFVVMNPPFHDAGHEDKALGQAFIQAAGAALRKGGVLWMVANRHLPYERVLADVFRTVEPRAEAAGYKLFEARK